MSMRDDTLSLRDMLTHAREAYRLLGATGRDEFQRERVLQLALTRLVEIVGEAASRVTVPTRQQHQIIPWQAIVGMRHHLAHGYDVIDHELLWDTIHTDLPPLIATLEQILEPQ